METHLSRKWWCMLGSLLELTNGFRPKLVTLNYSCSLHHLRENKTTPLLDQTSWRRQTRRRRPQLSRFYDCPIKTAAAFNWRWLEWHHQRRFIRPPTAALDLCVWLYTLYTSWSRDTWRHTEVENHSSSSWIKPQVSRVFEGDVVSEDLLDHDALSYNLTVNSCRTLTVRNITSRTIVQNQC